MKKICIIPARLESSRFPGKPLFRINGKPMIQWVLERCKRSTLANSLFLCTDSKELISLSVNLGIKAIETSSKCESGTERISTIVRDICDDKLEQTIIINGLITLAFGLLPGFAFLVVKAVDLSGISISATYYVVSMTVSLFIGGVLNTARLNNKFKKVQNI